MDAKKPAKETTGWSVVNNRTGVIYKCGFCPVVFSSRKLASEVCNTANGVDERVVKVRVVPVE